MEAEKLADKWQRTKYDTAFQAEVVCCVTQGGHAATRVVQALGRGMSEALLGRWVCVTRVPVQRLLA